MTTRGSLSLGVATWRNAKAVDRERDSLPEFMDFGHFWMLLGGCTILLAKGMEGQREIERERDGDREGERD